MTSFEGSTLFSQINYHDEMKIYLLNRYLEFHQLLTEHPYHIVLFSFSHF